MEKKHGYNQHKKSLSFILYSSPKIAPKSKLHKCKCEVCWLWIWECQARKAGVFWCYGLTLGWQSFKFSPLGMQVNGHSSWHHFNNNYNLVSCRECSQCPRHYAVHSGCALAHLIPIANHWGKFLYYPHFPGGHREIWKCWRSHS